ncbi:MAG: NERD domain-containing protein/DEAD/DEAH box helicase [Acidimicrobiales bacterium]
MTDGWLIPPDVGLRGHRDYQLDLVLVHEEWGILDIEVKGHRVQVKDGVWCHAGSRMEPQPMDQARTNAYALRDRLRLASDELSRIDVEYAVALPNTTEADGTLPADLHEAQLLTVMALEDPRDAIETLMTSRRHRPLTRADVEAIVQALRPDLDFAWDPEARARAVRERLDELCASQVAALETLDGNRRAFVAGRAGTGKTRLAMGWARRALIHREERVLLTCYNDPLADAMRGTLSDDPDLVIGPFLRVAFELDGMPPIDVPDDADHEWWNTQAVAHLHRYWHLITDRFDTVVVDEGQDFSPAWLAFLEQLLDPEGPRRMLVVADDAQNLYDRGFRAPSSEDGWAVAELVNNCRNVYPIATILRRYLDGAKAPMVGPEALGVEWHPADDLPQVTTAVNDRLVDLLEIDERDPAKIVVATFLHCGAGPPAHGAPAGPLGGPRCHGGLRERPPHQGPGDRLRDPRLTHRRREGPPPLRRHQPSGVPAHPRRARGPRRKGWPQRLTEQVPWQRLPVPNGASEAVAAPLLPWLM